MCDVQKESLDRPRSVSPTAAVGVKGANGFTSRRGFSVELRMKGSRETGLSFDETVNLAL